MRLSLQIAYAYSYKIVGRAVNELRQRGVDALRIVMEEENVPFSESVARANSYYKASGKKAILVSVHYKATGNASPKSQLLAWKMAKTDLIKKADLCLAVDMNMSQFLRQVLYWTADLYICRKANFPAILVENFFQDNRQDVVFLLSKKGKRCVTNIKEGEIIGYLQTV